MFYETPGLNFSKDSISWKYTTKENNMVWSGGTVPDYKRLKRRNQIQRKTHQDSGLERKLRKTLWGQLGRLD